MAELVVAMDFQNSQECLAFAGKISGAKVWYKIGLELFTAEGTGLVRHFTKQGVSVFLDLKFHDIPNTVRGATKSATKLGVKILTIHAAGGEDMARAAVQGRDEALAEMGVGAGQKPLIFGVTVLTSEAGLCAKELKARVVLLAQTAKAAGLDGVVCSGQEAQAVKEACGKDFLCLCPGIRFADGANDDQSRVCTPEEAVILGANFLVMGRPITKAADPMQKINEALQGMSCTF